MADRHLPVARSAARPLAAVLLLASLVSPARADGFAIRDLSLVAADARSALGADFVNRAEPQRVTLMCPKCDGGPMIDVLLGRQDDGTEGRVRSGETPISRLEDLCRARDPECRVTALGVAPAVGWISSYRVGGTAGATAVLLRDGDLLTVRSLAANPGAARANAEKLVAAIAPKIVGR